MNNIRTICWDGCGHVTTENAGQYPAETQHRDVACLACRNAELAALEARPGHVETEMMQQPMAQDADEHGTFLAPVYPVRSGKCGMCGRSLAAGGHPSSGVCDNV